MGGPVRSGWLSQPSPIPRSPDGDNNDSLINTARIIDFLVRVQKDTRENCLPCTNMTLCTLESFALTFLLGLNPKYRIQVAPHEKYVHDHWVGRCHINTKE